ncbi:hypothetical protein J6590_075994 [Homalodisca vitripennis]|nr:hypothetical protein J6590_075994 [Homalodisca vitripennis]
MLKVDLYHLRLCKMNSLVADIWPNVVLLGPDYSGIFGYYVEKELFKQKCTLTTMLSDDVIAASSTLSLSPLLQKVPALLRPGDD